MLWIEVEVNLNLQVKVKKNINIISFSNKYLEAYKQNKI